MAEYASYQLRGGEDLGTIAIPDPIGESLPDLDLGLAKADGDYLDQLDQMSRQVDRGDTIADMKPAVIALDDLLPKIATLRVPLEEARRLIGEKKYEEALDQLRQILTAPGEPHEAVYLIALCHYHLDRLEEALGALRPLPRATLDAGMARRVQQLKQQIRRKVLGIVIVETLLQVRKNQPEKPIERLRGLTHLDPEFGLFHFLLAGNLMTAGRMEEALDAAEAGLTESDSEHHKQIEGLKEDIVRRLLEVKMDKARTHYRKGKPAKARSALEGLDARYRESRLWITFHDYLEELGGGVLSRGKQPRDVKPPGSFKDVDALHFFLVRGEIGQAKLAMSLGLLEPAMQALDVALSHAPHFPYMHFLMALCLYRRTAEAIRSGSPPSPDEAIERLSTALQHAGEGAKDKEISSAKELKGAIESAIEAMRSVKKELDIRKREVHNINAVVTQYKAVMQLVGDGISSREQWRKVSKEMGKVKKTIGSVRPGIRRPEGRKALDQLESVVDDNLGQLDALESKIKQAEAIKKAMDEFAAIRESAAKGISSRAEVQRLQGRLAKLDQRITTLKESAEDEGAKQALAELQKAVARDHGQITDVLDRPPKIPREVKEFNELAEEFQALMKSVQRSKISSPAELDDFKTKLADLGMRAASLNSKMTDKAGKEATKQLMQAIANVFGQLPP